MGQKLRNKQAKSAARGKHRDKLSGMEMKLEDNGKTKAMNTKEGKILKVQRKRCIEMNSVQYRMMNDSADFSAKQCLLFFTTTPISSKKLSLT